ncbi:MAG: RluA family pseudouridine synthase [Helicobacter sp.]|nr:RluA family pseudouridine synthase [Helicobacter sp.]
MEKAYKLLAKAQNISHTQAKTLIDKGLVLACGKRLHVARALLPKHTTFEVRKEVAPMVLFEDKDCLALDKPPFVVSEDLLRGISLELINRLDKETSGVILLGTHEFKQRAVAAYQKKQAYKEYRAVVCGLLKDEQTIDAPILTRKGTKAYSIVSDKGQSAITHIEPLEYRNNKTLLKIITHTGRTHQIRVHLAHIGFPILGDVHYGGRGNERIMLHALKLELLGYHFHSPLPKIFMD